jgi:hypothetical protein
VDAEDDDHGGQRRQADALGVPVPAAPERPPDAHSHAAKVRSEAARPAIPRSAAVWKR